MSIQAFYSPMHFSTLKFNLHCNYYNKKLCTIIFKSKLLVMFIKHFLVLLIHIVIKYYTHISLFILLLHQPFFPFADFQFLLYLNRS